MGLFSRKSSQPSIRTSTTSINSTSQASIKSPSVRSPAHNSRSPQFQDMSNRYSNSSQSSNLPATNGSGTSTPRAKVVLPKIDMPKAPNPQIDPAAYLRSIGAVRERCNLILGAARRNQLTHFDVDMSKFEDTTSFVVSVIKRDFAPDYASIPPHGRLQHFNVGGKDRIAALLAMWPSEIDASERTRRLLDLFLVSVLLDAGAGTAWSYKSLDNGRIYRRSEGLAVASLDMFKKGLFSSNPSQPHQVDGEGLRRLTVQIMSEGLQVSPTNPLAGLEGRANLLIRLGEAMKNKEYFGADERPGNMIDYLLAHPSTQASSVPIVPLPTLWNLLMNGLAPVWPPSRTVIDGTSLGDAWPLSTLSSLPSTIPNSLTHAPWETIVPFHKLTQWLCYSLMQPMTSLINIHFAGAELMTGLPEYRNGGLFVDTGVLTLKPDDYARGVERFKQEALNGGRVMEVVPMFEPSDDVIVEWRAVTVGFLDVLLESVNAKLGLSGADALSLPQMLEAGSWKGGRELAEVSRPNTKEPPIMIVSDGTVF